MQKESKQTGHQYSVEEKRLKEKQTTAQIKNTDRLMEK